MNRHLRTSSAVLLHSPLIRSRNGASTSDETSAYIDGDTNGNSDQTRSSRHFGRRSHASSALIRTGRSSPRLEQWGSSLSSTPPPPCSQTQEASPVQQQCWRCSGSWCDRSSSRGNSVGLSKPPRIHPPAGSTLSPTGQPLPSCTCARPCLS